MFVGSKKQSVNFGVLSIGLAAMVFFISSATPAQSSVIPAFFQPLPSVLDTVKTPKDLVRFMRSHFKFTEDSELFGTLEYWQTPEEFFIRKAGDCEDYALFSQLMLTQMNIESYVVSFYGTDGYAHTVTIFKDDKGTFNAINEDRLYRYKAKSLESALTRIHPVWKWAAIAEIHNGRGKSLKRIDNPVFSK